MKALILVVAVVLIVAPCATAQEPPSLKLETTAFLLSAAADKASTVYALKNPLIIENFPLYRGIHNKYGIEAHFAVSSAVDVSTALLVRKVGKKHHRLAQVAFWSLTAMRTFQTIRNVQNHGYDPSR